MTNLTTQQHSLITLATLAARLDPDNHGQTLADASNNMGTAPLLVGISDTALGGIIEKIDQEILDKIAEFHDELVGAQIQLKALIGYIRTQKRPKPEKEPGGIEFGIVPYWVANPDQVPDGDNPIIQGIMHVMQSLQKFGVIPAATITDSEYGDLMAAIQTNRVFASDGTMFGIMKYQQLDPHWLEAVVNMILTELYGYSEFYAPNLDCKADKGAKYCCVPKPVALPKATSGDIKIAILGDWGTGQSDAQQVMKSAISKKPDYLIHLGDVYYTGTPPFHLDEIYLGEDMEQEHLVDLWPKNMATGRSFTMNSNHEMYCGARGLFQVALANDIFAAQQGKSYFLLQNEAWQIFGLDSGFASPDFLKMNGALNQEQIDFVRANVDRSKQTLFLTHHTGISPDGTQILYNNVEQTTGLILDVSNALSPTELPTPTSGPAQPQYAPDYWYWGHVHDGIVYTPWKIGGKDCNMRCSGNASMPYGAPWGLTRAGSTLPFDKGDFLPSIEFFSQTPMCENDYAGQVKNGFSMITLNGDTITESFFDQDGACKWSSDAGF